MKTNHNLKKVFAVGIILLFISSIEAAYLNVTIVKGSNTNTLIAMTTEWCGSKDHRPQTILLTTHQVTEVNHLIRNLQDCLKAGITKEETLIRFKNTIASLDHYGLLPEGMTSEQIQHILQVMSHSKKEHSFRERIIYKNQLLANQSNYLCFITGTITKGNVVGPLQIFGAMLTLLALILHMNILGQFGLLIMGISHAFTTISPVSLLQRVIIQSGTLTSVGLNGVQQFNISDLGNEAVISGFTGIKLGSNETGQIQLLGVAVAIET